MFGKLIPYLVLGWLDAAFCLVIAALWFGVPFRGTLVALFLTTTLFLVVVLSIGYLISVLIRSQVGASQIALLVTLLPTTLLSGYVFPIDQMPPVIQEVTYLIYSRYYVTIIKAIFLKGAGIAGAGDADPVPRRLRAGRRACSPPAPSASASTESRTAMFARIMPIVIKEFLELRRDKWARFRLIVPPIVQMLCSAMPRPSRSITSRPSVLDLDHSQESRELDRALHLEQPLRRRRGRADRSTRSRPPSIAATPRSRSSFTPASPNCCARARARRSQVIVDGTNSNTALIALGYINTIAAGFAQDYAADLTRARRRACRACGRSR